MNEYNFGTGCWAKIGALIIIKCALCGLNTIGTHLRGNEPFKIMTDIKTTIVFIKPF